MRAAAMLAKMPIAAPLMRVSGATVMVCTLTVKYKSLMGLVSKTISDLYFTVNVQTITVAPLTLIKGAAIGIFASIAAALIPSYEATRTPPAGTMRRSDVEQRALRLVP